MKNADARPARKGLEHIECYITAQNKAFARPNSALVLRDALDSLFECAPGAHERAVGGWEITKRAKSLDRIVALLDRIVDRDGARISSVNRCLERIQVESSAFNVTRHKAFDADAYQVASRALERRQLRWSSQGKVRPIAEHHSGWKRHLARDRFDQLPRRGEACLFERNRHFQAARATLPRCYRIFKGAGDNFQFVGFHVEP